MYTGPRRSGRGGYLLPPTWEILCMGGWGALGWVVGPVSSTSIVAIWSTPCHLDRQADLPGRRGSPAWDSGLQAVVDLVRDRHSTA